MKNLFRLVLVLLFRTSCWILITSNFTTFNFLLGFFLSVLIPLGSYKSLQLRALIPSLLNIVKIIPSLITETWQIIRIRRPVDLFKVQHMCPFTLRGSKFAQFIQVIAITSTPMSIVAGKSDDENWIVHLVGDKRNQP